MPRDCTALPATQVCSGCTVPPGSVGSNTRPMKRNNQYTPDLQFGTGSRMASYAGLPGPMNKILREQSREWMTAVLDPYHDNSYDVEGLPDERTAPSVVQIHNQSYTLTAPLLSSGNWDATIWYSGFNSLINAPSSGGLTPEATESIHTYDHASLNLGIPFGALNIQAVPAGTDFACAAASPNVGYTYVALGSCLSTDRCRVIGVAFEVHNTTAELTRQGSMTVAMLPDCGEDVCSVQYCDTNAAPIGAVSLQADRGPTIASTLPPLQAVPGSQTWPAADGVYAIPRMTKCPREIMQFNQINASSPTNRTGSVRRVPIVADTAGNVGTPEMTGWYTPSGTTYSTPLIRPFRPSGFSPIQTYWTGLSSATTLTVTFRTIVEYFPALDSPLLPLASPSACFDPDALRIYSEIISMAPYAVPVSENAAGDYFRRIAMLAGKALVLTSPLFGQFAFAANAAGRTLSLLSEKKKTKLKD